MRVRVPLPNEGQLGRWVWSQPACTTLHIIGVVRPHHSVFIYPTSPLLRYSLSIYFHHIACRTAFVGDYLP